MPSEAAAALLEAAASLAASASAGDAAAANAPSSEDKVVSAQEPASSDEKPPEDLELRARLEAFSKEKGLETARRDLRNAAKVLRRLFQEPGNKKLHEMRRDVLDRMVGEHLFFAFVAAGFEEGAVGKTQVLSWRGEEAAGEALRIALHEVQRAGDFAVDLDTLSFAQVAELVQQYPTLPGTEDVNDKVAEPVPAKESTIERPRKPWEK
mmetsp:Transcript_56837/g.144079  ORF Transcript_56837/g.144079 Transcript_56837/m.144079 type:complete len:209 (-) Transcript_56837:41-667(-)